MVHYLDCSGNLLGGEILKRTEIDLKDFLQVSARLSPLLGDIEKLARMTPIEKDRKALWALREELFQIYLRYWSISKGVFPVERLDAEKQKAFPRRKRPKR